MKYTLVLSEFGSGILEDDDGNTLWTSDEDETFLETHDEFIDEEDADNVIQYLKDADIVPESANVEVDVHYPENDDDGDEEDEDDG